MHNLNHQTDIFVLDKVFPAEKIVLFQNVECDVTKKAFYYCLAVTA